MITIGALLNKRVACSLLNAEEARLGEIYINITGNMMSESQFEQ